MKTLIKKLDAIIDNPNLPQLEAALDATAYDNRYVSASSGRFVSSAAGGSKVYDVSNMSAIRVNTCVYASTVAAIAFYNRMVDISMTNEDVTAAKISAYAGSDVGTGGYKGYSALYKVDAEIEVPDSAVCAVACISKGPSADNPSLFDVTIDDLDCFAG